ncbi:redox-sensing transcriptional repressor Rex [Mesoterricola silvestris]|uniref:redox-sensing transcriptional repressor Rex n=1 Tax=Mesoterricola silvestris TaxID=2927979 RepID=UPI00292E0C75|nr:redox-sensing transcriptional repressor Rex [Mesoterricola silvestris]
MPGPSVPIPTLRRLPRYYQYLSRLKNAGQEQVSAAHMAEVLGVHHTQVRKDLAITGCQGRPKTGHKISELLTAIEGFLHWDSHSDAFLVGVGSLGTALMKYPGFDKAGARIVAAFDHDPTKAGLRIGDTPVLPMEKFTSLAERMHIAVGILTVPSEAAQATADLMVGSGIRAIWNFAPVNLDVPDHVIVENLELFTSLALLLRKLSDTCTPQPVG